MYTDRDDQLNQLLGSSIEWLDITDQDYRLMVSRYRAVGASLDEYWDDSPAGGEVYPQGSMRLGTITRNIHRNDDIDIDLVARRDLAKTSVTQAALKEDVGAGLELFVKEDREGGPQLEEGKRCWTLQYPGFHVDVLPGPARRAGRRHRDQHHGHRRSATGCRRTRSGSPNWFRGVMREEHLALVEKRMAINPVPEWSVKTTLQRTVQALKRHRDIYFTGHLDDRPASVIITTLAARAYTGGGSLYEVLRDRDRRHARAGRGAERHLRGVPTRSSRRRTSRTAGGTIPGGRAPVLRLGRAGRRGLRRTGRDPRGRHGSGEDGRGLRGAPGRACAAGGGLWPVREPA